MKEFYTPDTFNQDKYIRNSWVMVLSQTEYDNGQLRLIVRVATGRKYWPLFSEVVNFELGTEDPALKKIKFSLNYYSFPMIDRFVDELNVALTDIYEQEIDLRF
jgi:hypothetical protein